MLALLCLILTVSFNSNAQDIIVKTNQEEIKAKIIEVGTDAIKYKKTSMKDGPSFVIRKQEVFMIIYADGSREFMNDPSRKETTSSSSTSSSTILPDYQTKKDVSQSNESVAYSFTPINKKIWKDKSIKRKIRNSTNDRIITTGFQTSQYFFSIIPLFIESESFIKRNLAFVGVFDFPILHYENLNSAFGYHYYLNNAFHINKYKASLFTGAHISLTNGIRYIVETAMNDPYDSETGKAYLNQILFLKIGGRFQLNKKVAIFSELQSSTNAHLALRFGISATKFK